VKQRFQALQSKGLKPCPSDRPFYDDIACIACPQLKPNFNIDTLKCTRCKHGRVWNEQIHGCGEAQGGAGGSRWTLIKGLGSILSKKA
jgi:hypothetical protein